MDVITLFIICGLLMFLLFSLCGWCCRKSKPEASFVSVAVPVATTVPSMPHGHNPPYPVQQMIMPQPTNQPMSPLPIGFTAYPHAGQTGYPHPGTRDFSAPTGYNPYPGYPPQTAGASMQQHPPTYDEATSGSQMYNPQSAYNPNYKSN